MSTAVLGSTTLIRLLSLEYRLELSNGGGSDTYTLSFLGETTAPIAEGASATTVQAALELLTVIGAGDVAVAGLAGGPYGINFTGKYLGQVIPFTAGNETGALEALLSKQILEPDLQDSITDGTNLNTPSRALIGPGGSYGYVTSSVGDSLAVVDMTDPDNISLADTIIDATNINEPLDVVVNAAETLAFTANKAGDGMAVIDISTKTAIAKLGQILGDTDLNGCQRIAIGGSEDYVYTASTISEKLNVNDVTTPASPSNVGNVALGDSPSGLAVLKDESYAFCPLGGTNEVVVVDISTPATPTVVASPEIAGGGVGRCVLSPDESTLFIVDIGADTLIAVDVSNPLTPTRIATLDMDGVALEDSIAISPDGQTVYLTSDTTVYLIDSSSPARMEVIGAYRGSSGGLLTVGVSAANLLVPASSLNKVSALDLSTTGGGETTVGSQVDASQQLSNGKDEITNKQSPSLSGGGLAKEHILTDQEATLDMNNIFTPSPGDAGQTSLAAAARDLIPVQLVIYDSDAGSREIWRNALVQNLGNTNPHNGARRQAWSFLRSGNSVFAGM